MKLIPLSANKKCKHSGKYFAMVDDEDYPRLIKFNWSVTINKWTKYAVRFTLKKDSPTGKRVPVKMHRDIMCVTDIKIEPDHIDHNGLNNQKSNLRLASSSQQKHNTKGNKNSTSIYKGVSYHASRDKWIVQIVINYKNKFIGRFNTEIEAAQAYDAAAIKYHGDFAYLNFPKTA